MGKRLSRRSNTATVSRGQIEQTTVVARRLEKYGLITIEGDMLQLRPGWEERVVELYRQYPNDPDIVYIFVWLADQGRIPVSVDTLAAKKRLTP